MPLFGVGLSAARFLPMAELAQQSLPVDFRYEEFAEGSRPFPPPAALLLALVASQQKSQ